MPTTEHERLKRRLRSEITRTRNKARNQPLLADKLAVLAAVKKLEQDLRAHLLNAFASSD